VADPVDELFELPLDEFTAARNRLAKEHPEATSISKPTVPAWVVNQLARRHPELVERLVAAGEAQLQAIQGKGDLRAAQAEERKALGELSRRAGAVLKEAGRPSAAMLDRVAATLAAGAQTAEGRELLRSGRLTEELEPAGFAALAGITPVTTPARGEKREDSRRRERELRDAARALEGKALEAEREADRAETAAQKARTAAEKARRKADEAADTLEAFRGA
jgi:hypothetical protein